MAVRPRRMERLQMDAAGLRSKKEAEANSSITIQIAGAKIHVKRLTCTSSPAPAISGIANHKGEFQARATIVAPITSGGWMGPCLRNRHTHRTPSNHVFQSLACIRKMASPRRM
jgi:hypothetical protein